MEDDRPVLDAVLTDLDEVRLRRYFRRRFPGLDPTGREEPRSGELTLAEFVTDLHEATLGEGSRPGEPYRVRRCVGIIGGDGTPGSSAAWRVRHFVSGVRSKQGDLRRHDCLRRESGEPVDEMSLPPSVEPA